MKLVRNSLYLAMSDPLDFVAQDEVKTASRKRIIPMIATRKAVEQAISRLYGNEGTARVIEEMKREAGSSKRCHPRPDGAGHGGPAGVRPHHPLRQRPHRSGPIPERASDIHLEPQAEEMVVRMRVDGLLHQMLTVPADLKNMVVSRLKIMGSMDIAERRVPQDGHTTVQVRGHVIDLRISTIPTVYGEKLVLRLLDKSSQNLTKTGLGFEGRDLEKYEALLKKQRRCYSAGGPHRLR